MSARQSLKQHRRGHIPQSIKAAGRLGSLLPLLMGILAVRAEYKIEEKSREADKRPYRGSRLSVEMVKDRVSESVVVERVRKFI